VKKLLLAAASLLLLAAQDNSAVAINTKDDSTLVKISFKITRVNSDLVTPTNIAFAYSSCTGCETVAIAIQAVLVFGTDSSTIAPVNEAWAINWLCSGCTTVADAIQFTYTESGPVHFTPEGKKQIEEIRKALKEIGRSDMSPDQMLTAVDALSVQLQQVLETEVVPSGNSANPGAEGTPSPEASASPGSSPSPGASPSPEPSETPSPSASPSP